MKNRILRVILLFVIFAFLITSFPVFASNKMYDDPNQIISFSAIPPTYTIIENTCGYSCFEIIDGELFEYWEYNIDLYDFTFNITTADGTVYTDYTFNDVYETFRYPVWLTNQQSYYNQWQKGVQNFDIELSGITTTASIEIIESPFIKLEIFDDNKYMYKYDGYYTTYYDETTGWSICFSYDYSLTYKLYYADGSFELYTESDLYDKYNINATITDDQSLITKNIVTATLFGLNASTEVEIIESPVESVTLLSEPKTEYHILEESYIDGLTLKIKNKDGSTITHTVDYDPTQFSLSKDSNDYYINGYCLRDKLFILDEENCFLLINYAGYEIKTKIETTDSPYLYGNTTLEIIEQPFDNSFCNAVIRVTDSNGIATDYRIKKFFFTDADGGGNSTSFSERIFGYILTDKGLFYNCYFSSVLNLIEKEYQSLSLHFLGGQLECSDELLASINLEKKSEEYISDYFNKYFLFNSCKEYINKVSLENGNTKFVYDCDFEEIRKYTVVTEITQNGDIVDFSYSKRGDINKDGKIDIRDLVRIKKMAASIIPDDIDFADLERNQIIDSSDVLLLRKTFLLK